MDKVKPNEIESKIFSFGRKLKDIEKGFSEKYKNRLEYLEQQNKKLSQGLKKVFKIWDSFFKTLAVFVSIGITTTITIITRNLYYTNGKWDFSLVVIYFCIVYLLINTVAIWCSWILINNLLVDKIKAFELN